MKPYAPAASGLSNADRLAQIGMSPDELRLARVSTRLTELMVDTLLSAYYGLRRVFGFIGLGIGARACRNVRLPVRRFLLA